MPPKRPPPLPRSLFTDGGLLSPRGVPAPPSPSRIHPAFVTDAHARSGSPLALPANPDRPPVTGSVVVEGEPTGSKSKAVKPVVVNSTSLPSGVASDGSTFVDLIVPNTAPLTEPEWDHLEEIVNQIDGGFKAVEGDVAQNGEPRRKIIIAGLLPPPLTKPSSPLLQSDDYTMYQGRLAQLSLHADVVLKALPPVADTRVADGKDEAKWWEDAQEVDRVVKMYLAPAIETFGTHRIIFGSTPAAVNADAEVSVPISGAEWYALLRKTVSELGQDQEAMTNIMGANAEGLYDLK